MRGQDSYRDSMTWPWQQAEYAAMSKSPPGITQGFFPAAAVAAYPTYPPPQQPLRKTSCERHLAAVVCGVTALLAAMAMALLHFASTDRDSGTRGYRFAPQPSTSNSTPDSPSDFDSEAVAVNMDSDIIVYSGCEDCPEAEFCVYAGNPGCGGAGTAEAVTFDNSRAAEGCQIRPVLTIPRSYMRDIADLQAKGASLAKQLLTIMLRQGFREYRGRGYSGPVQQCLHLPAVVSVHWLHLHSFCAGAHFDGMPDAGSSMCRVMNDINDADWIAGDWSVP
mmetsp:Transcript_119246/g.320049  ORF Transcript_119246/g.320049 Transcript_119246/m.320049 type:complete len:278 (+) Transcript_119246:82-915(+)